MNFGKTRLDGHEKKKVDCNSFAGLFAHLPPPTQTLSQLDSQWIRKRIFSFSMASPYALAAGDGNRLKWRPAQLFGRRAVCWPSDTNSQLHTTQRHAIDALMHNSLSSSDV